VVPASGTFEKFGPRVNDLVFSVWGDPLSEAEALAGGLIDVMDCAAPAAYIEPPADWWTDPEITLGELAASGIYFFALNNQMWPIGHGGWINYTCQRCLDARQFRRALAHLSDKAAMVTNMKGYAEAKETFIPPILHDWEGEESLPIYEYNQTLAEQALIEGGFKDWDSDLVMEYSPGHDGVVVEELPSLRGWIRSDDPDRTYASQLLRNELIKLGIPESFTIADRSTCYYHVYVARDFHVYTDSLSGRDPGGCYEIFYSGSESHIGYWSEEFDYWFEKFKYAATMEEGFEACHMFIRIIARDVASIPLYSLVGYFAHRTNYGTHPGEEIFSGKWEGFANELGVGFSNFWTYLNAHPEEVSVYDPYYGWFVNVPDLKGGTLRQGMLFDIERFSPVHAEWFNDWLVLNQIYEPLIKYHPYNATEYVPWLAQSYEVGTWDKSGVGNCTKIRFKLIPGIRFHDLTLLTPEDVAFTYQYMKDWISVAWYWAVTNFDHAEVIDDLTVDICFNSESLWALSWSMVPVLPKHIWEGKDPAVWNPEEDDKVIGTGPFMCRKDGVVGRVDHVPGQYVHLEANPLYHRKYIWPDVCDAIGNVGVRDGWVTIIDWGSVAYYISFPRAYDPALDVDKNGVIDFNDLLEIGIAFGKRWPPPWYVNC